MSKIERQKRVFIKYFGENPKMEDMVGYCPFSHTYEELEQLAADYRDWYKCVSSPTWDSAPDVFKLPYKIHHNLSGEILSRIKLASKLMDEPFQKMYKEILPIKSIPIPIDDFTGATIYTSTIYRGKTQVDTGNIFEQKVAEYVNGIDSVEMMPGSHHDGKRYDKDIYIDEKYTLSAEISFQRISKNPLEQFT